MSDLNELFEQLADGPVLLATDRETVDADWDNGTTLHGTPRRGRREVAAYRRLGARSARRRRRGRKWPERWLLLYPFCAQSAHKYFRK